MFYCQQQHCVCIGMQKMAALGYVYTLGKQTLGSHNCCTNWSATGAEFIEVQTLPHVFMHDWDLYVPSVK